MILIIVGVVLMILGVVMPGNIEDPGIVDVLKAGSFLAGFFISVKGFKGLK